MQHVDHVAGRSLAVREPERGESVLDGLIDGVGGGADGVAVLPFHQNPRFLRARVERLVRVLEKMRGTERKYARVHEKEVVEERVRARTEQFRGDQRVFQR